MTRDRTTVPPQAAVRGAPHSTLCWLMPADGGAAALELLRSRLPADVSLLVGIRAGGQHAGLGEDDPVGERIELPRGGTLAHLVNRAVERRPGTDVVLLFSSATPTGDWLERLRAAARSESIAATASGLPRSALAAPGLDRSAGGEGQSPAKAAGSIEQRARAVAATSARLHPRLLGVLPGCVYLRASALELVGRLDETLGSSYAAVLDFAFRARERGLTNLLADDVLVEAPAFGLSDDDRVSLTANHPGLMAALEEPAPPPVERSLSLANVALERLTATVDARALGPHVGGTQEYLLGLIESLVATHQVRLRVLVAPDLGAATHARLRALAGCELLSFESALSAPEASHVVHRPQQVFSADDLLLLRPLGKRVVVTHQDLIAYHNPAYFASAELWHRYVRTTRRALSAADHVVFFSHHALDDAVREDLVEPARCTVAYLGTDLGERRPDGKAPPAGSAPAGLPSLAGTPFLLCIGADYQHKNRPFAIAVLDELRRRHQWPGALVLAGPHVEYGSSHELELATVRERGLTAEHVIDLAAVSDSERNWLMHAANAVIYPTVHEGFGLVPFEAAAAGIPCLFAPQSSLLELIDGELATLLPWDAARSAEQAVELLSPGEARAQHVQQLAAAAGELRWSDCAKATLAAYHDAIAAPYRDSTADAWQALEREREIVRLDHGATELTARLHELSNELGEDAVALVGQHALLSGSDQHLVVAVAARPKLKKLVFGVLEAGFRIMRALRRQHVRS
jgi:Glycosyl transferases group 1